jgi:hypothetical protein
VILARGVFGLVANQTSLTVTDLTALAEVIGTAFAACAGKISDSEASAAIRPMLKRRETFTDLAYSSNLGIP